MFRNRRMVLALVALLTVTLVASGPADAAKKKKKKKTTRKVEATYMTPGGVAGAGGGFCGSGVGCVSLGAAGPKERYLTISIADTLPTSPYATWGQDLDGDGFTDNGEPFCGQTEVAAIVEPGVEILVFINEGPGPTPVCPGGSSTGTVTGTFSNLP